jgi:hypothetical protein
MGTALLLVAGPVLAEVVADYNLSWRVIAGSGGRMESGGHAMWGTVGQSTTGTMVGANHALCSGFWCLTAGYRVYLPLVLRSG